MSLRAIIIGLMLGWGVSASLYFHDFVIAQPPLLGHLLPATVLGCLLALLVVFNPLAAHVRLVRPLGGGEVAIIAAMGLAACSFPETGFFRIALTNLAVPGYLHQTRVSWQAQEAFAYVPGAVAVLGEGHVQDWPALARELATAGEHAPDSVLGRIWHRLPARHRHDVAQIARDGVAAAQVRRTLVRALNDVLHRETLQSAQDADNLLRAAYGPDASPAIPQTGLNDATQVALNRLLLVEAVPGAVLPPPHGYGVLPLGGQHDSAVTDQLVAGGGDDAAVPWSAWWPPLQLWGGVVLLLGVATLCLTMVVHPQWSHNELLPYPIARFVNEMCRRDPGRMMPTVMSSPLFWWGFGALFTLHLTNGLAAWLPDVGLIPTIPRQLDFRPLRELFPIASQIDGSQAYLSPKFVFSIVAFAFFLPGKVSWSMGIAPLLFVILGTAMLSIGVPMENDYLGAGNGNLLRFGAYLGAASMILYIGRHYYAQVVRGAIGIGREPLPSSTLWAARGAAVSAAAAVALLTSSGLHWTFSVAVLALVVLIFVVIARIVAETGMFAIQPYWMPVAVFSSLMGLDAINPTTFILLALASTMIVGDTRSLLMGHLVNAFQIVDRAHEKPARAAPWMLTMIVTGFVVAGAASLYVAYHFNAFAGMRDFTRNMLPAMPFDQLSLRLADAGAVGQVAHLTALSGPEQWLAAQPDLAMVGWAGFGMALVVACAWARLRLPWWPLHPVVFLVWGTYPATVFAASFLLGWTIKALVVSIGGARAYRTVLPLMIGVITGEIAIHVLWLSTGAIYYFVYGRTPPIYAVFDLG